VAAAAIGQGLGRDGDGAGPAERGERGEAMHAQGSLRGAGRGNTKRRQRARLSLSLSLLAKRQPSGCNLSYVLCSGLRSALFPRGCGGRAKDGDGLGRNRCDRTRVAFAWHEAA
jgi:hypothetical protein